MKVLVCGSGNVGDAVAKVLEMEHKNIVEVVVPNYCQEKGIEIIQPIPYRNQRIAEPIEFPIKSGKELRRERRKLKRAKL